MVSTETTTKQLMQSEVIGIDGFYYPEEIKGRTLDKLPKVEEIIEHKDSKIEKKIREWIKAKLIQRTPVSKEGKPKGLLGLFKEKTTGTYDRLKNAANSVIVKMKMKAHGSENANDSIELKVFSQPIPKITLFLEVPEAIASEIRTEKIASLLKEEDEIRDDYEEIYRHNRKLEEQSVTSVKNEETKKRDMIVNHQQYETQLTDEIQKLVERLEFLTQNPPSDNRGERELEHLQQRLDDKHQELNCAKEEHRRQWKQFENFVDKRKNKESTQIDKYFTAENVMQRLLERKMVMKKQLQEYESRLAIASNEASQENGESDKQSIDWKSMNDTDRHTMRMVATGKMMSNFCEIINKNSYDYIQQVEGFVIGDQVEELGYATIRKAKCGLHGKEDYEYAVKIIDYSNTDHDYQSQLRKHGFRVMSYVKQNPFKRLVAVHSLFEVAHEKAFVFEEFCFTTLQAQLDEKGPKNEIETKQVMVSIMEAVNYLHSIGVAHHNLSPQCVLINQRGQIKVGGLELSTICWNRDRQKIIKQLGGRSHHGKNFAPEVHSDKTYDPMKADVYSCGTIAVYTLLKKYPYDAKYTFSYDYQWKETIEELEPKCSDSCITFLLSCGTQNPKLRPGVNTLLNHEWFA